MAVYEIVFSPTGGTQKVADCVTDVLLEDRKFIDLSGRFTTFSDFAFSEEDLCVFAVPSFGGRVPEVCRQRISEMIGCGAQAILIAVYGNRAYEDTLLELREILTDQNFRCIAAISAVAEHSIMHQFATGRPDERDYRQLTEFAQQIKNRLKNRAEEPDLRVPGNYPYREYNGVPMKPKADETCTNCGVCVQQCPVGAIPEEHPGETDPNLCITCMRCVAICPEHARSLDPKIVGASAKAMEPVCSVYKENELFF